ncbi:acyl-CoA/acyl-ACP dehydrogenase [Vicingaceae bacterium]|nr:acyl-CoA/acyl-ACP dehydrogenase [Vicingaceae bacterium]
MKGNQLNSSQAELSATLGKLAPQLEQSGSWPAEQLSQCAKNGVFRWFVGKEWGGLGWDQTQIVDGYIALSSACLTTAFVITQRTAASNRIEASENGAIKERLLPGLASGEIFATVGISHLTTSRRHLGKPILVATPIEDGFVLNGYCPWVTGADFADWLVVGASLENGQQILVAIERNREGVDTADPIPLVALSASRTGMVNFADARVTHDEVLAGPVENVMSRGGTGGRTGGLQTSALAIGLSCAAIDFVNQESEHHVELKSTFEALQSQSQELHDDIRQLAQGNDICSFEDLRARSNSLALRSSQSSLAAAKGAGYVASHPAGRWCREALFFLVWSCPQGVVDTNLCELAGV